MAMGKEAPGWEIDITGLTHAEVLAALYAQAKPMGLGRLGYVPGPMCLKEAQKIVDSFTFPSHGNYSPAVHLDYVYGRPIKVTLHENALRGALLYDRDNGEGQCAKIIAALKKQKEEHGTE